jgi:XTP/dITP diphosphohydrolase
MSLPQVERLAEVMARLRHACPWDAQQTHRSLVQYLIEETGETIEAIESGDHAHLREELGDLLLQVVFHAQIAAEAEPGFDLDDVAAGVADKLISRHPYVFASEDVPTDLHGSWEQRKAREKGRRSVLEGIPEQLSSLVLHRQPGNLRWCDAERVVEAVVDAATGSRKRPLGALDG